MCSNGVPRFDVPDWTDVLSCLGELEKVEVTVESQSKCSVSSHGTQEGNALSEYTRGNVAGRINFWIAAPPLQVPTRDYAIESPPT